MTKRNVLKIAAVVIITVLLAIPFGYLASMAIKSALYNATYKDKIDATKNQFDGYFDSLIENLENNGLLSDRPKIEFGKTKSYVNQRMNFSVNNFNFGIDLKYQIFNEATHLTVKIVESETSLNEIDGFKNESVSSVLSILDECFETEKFNKSKEYCDRIFLIDNHCSNKNANGVVEYSFGTHDTRYDASCMHETETVYFYCVSKFDLGYEFKAIIEYNI